LAREGAFNATEITIALSVRNSEKQIGPCIRSILAQTISEFEVLVVEDPPFDRTDQIIASFNDKRIKHIKNETKLGLSGSRNKGLEFAKGKYVFFTDADCVVSPNWIEQGLILIQQKNCIGVEGKTYYVSEKYIPTMQDNVVENKTGGQFPTCNIVYKKSVLNDIRGFDERFTYMEDRDLALRAKRLGKISFNPKMKVYHQKKTFTPHEFVQTAKEARNRVLLYKKLHDKTFFVWRIMYPLNLVAIFFPPMIISSFFSNRYKTKQDFALFPFIYVRLIYERLNFWDMCARERVFLI
jgi:glycosyltransferase involved in cell wall biosynthesis